MQLDKARETAIDLIKNKTVHRDYNRVVKLAKEYKMYITGQDIGSKLIQFVQRESKVQFDQRIKLTVSTTPAVAASVRQPFAKVTRTNRIKKNIKTGSDATKVAV